MTVFCVQIAVFRGDEGEEHTLGFAAVVLGEGLELTDGAVDALLVQLLLVAVNAVAHHEVLGSIIGGRVGCRALAAGGKAQHHHKGEKPTDKTLH